MWYSYHLFWISDVTVLGWGDILWYCLGFICYCRGLGAGTRGTICSCLPHHYGAKLRKSMKAKKNGTVIQALFLYCMLWSQMFCLLYFIFVCFLGSFRNFPTHLYVNSGTHQTVWSTIKTPPSSPDTPCLVHSSMIVALFIMSESLLFNAQWAICQLYHGENKFHMFYFNEMMLVFALY